MRLINLFMFDCNKKQTYTTNFGRYFSRTNMLIIFSPRLVDTILNDAYNGTFRTTAHVLRVPGPVPQPEIAAMPALVLHGPVHGGVGGPRAPTGMFAQTWYYVIFEPTNPPVQLGEMSGMPCRAQNSVSGCAGVPHQRHVAAVPRAAHGDHRGAARSNVR